MCQVFCTVELLTLQSIKFTICFVYNKYVSFVESLDTVSGKVSESTRLSTIDEKSCICSYKSFESVGSLKEDINIFGAIEVFYHRFPIILSLIKKFKFAIIIQILHSYPSIRQLSKECKDNIPKSTLNFLRQIKYFIEFVISKTQLMPAEERKKELHLRHVCSEIDQYKHEISGTYKDNAKIIFAYV